MVAKRTKLDANTHVVRRLTIVSKVHIGNTLISHGTEIVMFRAFIRHLLPHLTAP